MIKLNEMKKEDIVATHMFYIGGADYKFILDYTDAEIAKMKKDINHIKRLTRVAQATIYGFVQGKCPNMFVSQPFWIIK